MTVEGIEGKAAVGEKTGGCLGAENDEAVQRSDPPSVPSTGKPLDIYATERRIRRAVCDESPVDHEQHILVVMGAVMDGRRRRRDLTMRRRSLAR